MSIRGARRRPWLEIRRDERERRYISYQLYSLRKAAQGPTDDVRDVLPGKSFYDVERIRFTAKGLDVAYSLLYPRDERVITPQVMDIVGLQGLTAIWVDQCRMNESKRGILRGKYSEDEFKVIRDAFRSHGMNCRYTPFSKGQLLFEFDVIREMRDTLSPYLHPSMQAKLRLRKEKGTGDGSQPAGDSASRLLRLQ